MFGLVTALLLAAAPAQPADTWEGVLCAHDTAKGVLVGSNIYYSYGAAKVWTIGPDALAPVDLTKLVQAKAKPFYINNEAVTLKGAKFERYGFPRVLSVMELDPKPYAFKDGAPFYQEQGLAAGEVEVVYLLTQAVGCEFQPYAMTR